MAQQAADGEAGPHGAEQEGAGPVAGEALQVVEGRVEVALAESPGSAIDLVSDPANGGGGYPAVLGRGLSHRAQLFGYLTQALAEIRRLGRRSVPELLAGGPRHLAELIGGRGHHLGGLLSGLVRDLACVVLGRRCHLRSLFLGRLGGARFGSGAGVRHGRLLDAVVGTPPPPSEASSHPPSRVIVGANRGRGCRRRPPCPGRRGPAGRPGRHQPT